MKVKQKEKNGTLSEKKRKLADRQKLRHPTQFLKNKYSKAN
jgi:hypothetical protein